MSNDKLTKIIGFAKEYYDSLDESHGINHGTRVARSAMLIHQREGGSPFIVEAGAWLHQFHDNLDDLKNGLNTLGLSQSENEALYHIVDVCRPKKIHNAKTLEAKIIYDADALECIGPHGNMRELFCNLCTRGIDLKQSISKTIEVENLFISTIQTETGKMLCHLLSDMTRKYWDLYNIQERLDDSILKMV